MLKIRPQGHQNGVPFWGAKTRSPSSIFVIIFPCRPMAFPGWPKAAQGSHLGLRWALLGAPLGSLWQPFGSPWRPLGRRLAPIWCPLTSLWRLLGASRRLLAYLSCPLATLWPPFRQSPGQQGERTRFPKQRAGRGGVNPSPEDRHGKARQGKAFWQGPRQPKIAKATETQIHMLT